MKRLSSFSIILFTFVRLFLTPNLGAASFPSEAGEIPYQINTSDRIVIGAVSGIEMFRDNTIITIRVNEWLYNSFPARTIKVRSEIGTNMGTANEAVFTQNESVLLMLNDLDLNQKLFRVAIGGPGKHPISDRSAVIEVLKAQGKWEGEEQTGDKTNETETIKNKETTGKQTENVLENKTIDSGSSENTGTVGKQEGEFNSTSKSNSTSFIHSFWSLAIVFGAIMYIKRTKR